jgi:uncharacterized protein YbbK (DUF523 family)
MSPMLDPEGNGGQDLVLASACLLGIPCRYDGASCPDAELVALAARGRVVPICPEVVGGLETPRLPAEIEGAFAGLDGNAVLRGQTRVLRSDGTDMTSHFLRGARATLRLAQGLGIRRVVLNADSPSCGAGAIHEGRFAGTLVPGDGVTAALLRGAGFQVLTEQDFSGRDG